MDWFFNGEKQWAWKLGNTQLSLFILWEKCTTTSIGYSRLEQKCVCAFYFILLAGDLLNESNGENVKQLLLFTVDLSKNVFSPCVLSY